jgi:nitrate reductase NapE component
MPRQLRTSAVIMTKTLTLVQAQTQWDEQITELRDRAHDAHITAGRWDRAAIRLLGWPVPIQAVDFARRQAASNREDGNEWAAMAQRMRTCPHNPRNGGTGHKPAQTFWEFVQEIGPREIIDTLVWAFGMLAVAVIAAAGFIIAMIQNYPPGPDSPMPLLTIFGGLLTGFLAVTVLAGTIRDIQSLAHFAWDYLWGEPL